ncbi:MAG: choice-of-anchor D domain-containing protein [Verrucomicrobiaceae bacterium]|nr:choice-of-anchor D domain-containing protein [Verrucomicrobiaceae bacterium]
MHADESGTSSRSRQLVTMGTPPVADDVSEEINPLWTAVLDKASKGRIPRNPQVMQDMPDLGRVQVGQTIEFPLPGGRRLQGTVNLAGMDDRVRRVGGVIKGKRGSFSFAVIPTGKVDGQVLIDDEGSAVLYSQSNGTTQAIETEIGNVLCDPKPMAAALPTALLGTAPAATTAAIMPVLSSRPGASNVLFLDFDGASVTDSVWNSGRNIAAGNAGMTDAQITEVWNRVKEDFAPFNIDVTTSPSRYDGAAAGRRMRCIVTATDAWYNTPGKNAAGGVAYLWSYDRSGSSFSSTVPCWVFSNKLGYSAKNVAEAVSHELGHTLGLSHDGTSTVGYYTGHGSGATGWAPIMGVGYYRDLVQWSKGEYPDANNREDDLAVISGSTNGFGYIADEAGNTRGAAASLGVSGSSVSSSGVVNNSTDVDYFAVTVNAGTVNLSINPFDISPNLDIIATLENTSGTAVASSNPISGLSASLTATVSSGTYYVKVAGVGKGTLSDGYSSYGSTGAYTITGSLPAASPEIAVEQPAGNNLVDNSGTVAFGNVTTGSSSQLTFTIKNLGLSTLSGLGITKAGSHPADFTPSSLGSTSIAPGSTMTFTVSFAPAAVGVRSAVIRIASNDADENPFDINLTGTGVGATSPEIAVEQPVGTNIFDNSGVVGFGQVTVGTPSVKVFTVRNLGTATLSGLAVSKTGTNAAEYVIGSLGSTSLAPGSSASFSITFTPSAVGTRTAVIRVASNDADENPFDINVEGSGTILEPADIAVSLSGTNIANNGSASFGSMIVGSTPQSRTFVISNPGKQNLTGLAASFTGTNASDYSVVSLGSNSLAPNGTTNLVVNFSAGGAGNRTAALRIASNDPDENPFVINLSGTGTVSSTRTIGPDAYGYTATNNTPHTFTDISATGTAILDGVDDGATTIPVGFSFPFYGSVYTNVHVSSNGLITFQSQDTRFSNFSLASSSLGQPAIAVWWDDFVTSRNATDKLYYQTSGSSGSRVFRIQWDVTDIAGTDTTTPYRFNCEFHESTGQIRCNYLVVSAGTARDAAAQGTIGIQDLNGNSNNRHLHWSTDSASLQSGTAILYSPPAAPPEINLAEQGGSSLVDNGAVFNFGAIAVNNTITKTFVISNSGGTNLTGLALSKTGTAAGDYTLGSLSTTSLAPGASTTFTVSFRPSAIGARSAVIQVASNDGDENPFDINVSGVGGDSSIDPGWAPTVTGGVVVSMAMQADGKVIVGGTFTSINGVTKNRIARFNVDGSLDNTFNCSADAEVVCIAVQPDGRIVLGGLFTTINSTTRNGLARVNADGSLDSSITHNADSFVYALALQPDGKILVGGGFNDIGGVARNCIARLNANGSLDTGFTVTASNTVDTIAVQPDNRILIGGIFDTVGGVARAKCARLMADGSVDTSFTANADNWVQAIAVRPDGSILLGGTFSTINGVTRNAGAKVSSTGVLDTAFNPNFSSWVYSIGIQANGSSIWAGWFANAQGVSRGGLARFASDGVMESFPNTWMTGVIRSCVLQANGNMMLGGSFTDAGGFPRTGLVRVLNNVTGSQSLQIEAQRVTWSRTGSTPEISQPVFELSINGGASWSALGTPARVASGWQLNGLSLPGTGTIRARGLADGGNFNGCESVIEQSATFSLVPDIAVRQGASPLDALLVDAQTTPLSFGSTPAGTPVSKTLLIENTGTGNLTLSTPTRSGTNSSDFTITGPSAGTLAPGGTATITITFNPAAAGTRSAVIILPSNDPDENPFDINVTGVATAPMQPDIVIEQPSGTNLVDGSATVAFGNVGIGSNATRIFTVRNTGTANLTLNGINSSLIDYTAGPFGTTTVAPGQSTTFTITFAPGAAGARNSNLQITSNDPDETPFDVLVTGTGVVSSGRDVGPDSYGYRASSNVPFQFTDISTTGTAVLDGVDDDATALALPFAFQFYGVSNSTVYINSNGLATFGALDYNYSNVDLRSNSLGKPAIAVMWDDFVTSYSALDRVYYQTSGAVGSRVFTVQWTVSPIGEASLPAMTFQMQLMEGSNQIRCNYQQVRVGSVKDEGAAATVGIQDTNGNANGRFVHWSFNQVSSVIGGTSIVFTPPGPPADIAVFDGAISLVDGASTLVVPSANLGETRSVTLTITNQGSSPLTGLSVTKDGVNQSEFSVTQPGAVSLAAGASTTMTLLFTPSSAGAKTAALHIASNDVDENPFDIPVSASAMALPKIQVTDNTTGGTLVDGSSSLSFDAVGIGSPAQRVITIRNTGAGTLSGLALSRTGSTDFSLSSLPVTTLAPGSSTTFTVTFSPSSLGAKSGAVQIASNDADIPSFDFTVSGVGAQIFSRNVDTATGHIWRRPVANGANAPSALSSSATAVRYQSMQFSVTQTGVYSIRSTVTAANPSFDNYLFLYAGSFSATSQLTNVRIGNDDFPNVGVSGFSYDLVAGTTYYLVTTGYSNTDAGVVVNTIEGPGAVNAAVAAPEFVLQVGAITLETDSSVINFGTLAPGASSSVTFVVRNTGDLVLSDVSSVIVGENSADFATPPLSGITLSGGASLPVNVSFAPIGTGVRRAILRFTSSDPNTPIFDVELLGDVSAPPTIVTQPSDSIVAVGEPLQLTTEVTGSNPLTISWTKNGSVVAGQTTRSLTVASASIASAGAYQMKLSNRFGNLNSRTAQVAVVDATDRSQMLNEGSTATFTAAAAGNSLAYQWYRNSLELNDGDRVSGSRGKVLTIRRITPDDDGVYHCRVTAPGGVRYSGDETLTVFNQAPLIVEPLILPDAYVSGYYEFQVPVDGASERTPSGFGATGLPPGLAINSRTGLISGRPTSGRAAPYTVTLTASNARGKSTVTLPLIVVPLSPNVAGNYVGVIARHSVLNQDLGGKVEMAINSSGQFTGKCYLGIYQHVFSGVLDTTDGMLPVWPHAHVVINRAAPLSPIELTFTVDADNHRLGDGFVSDGANEIELVAYRNQWSTASPPPMSLRGVHAFGLQISDDLVGSRNIPQGYGYGTITVTSTGAFTVAGKMADGETLTASGFVAGTGEAPIFQLLYTTTLKGSLVGNLELVDVSVVGETSVSGLLTWSRPLNTSASARLYKNGFEPIEIAAFGGTYTPPVAPELVLGLNLNDGAALLEFGEGGINSTQSDPGIAVTIGAGNTIILPSVNPRSTSLAVTAATGAVRGGFTLVDPSPLSPGTTVTRSVAYQGQIVRTDSGYMAVGYFILPALPTVDQPNALLTRQESGWVLLSPAP